MLATRFIRSFYKYIAKPLLFTRDPERVHDAFLHLGRFLGTFSFTRFVTRLCFFFANLCLEQDILGIRFSNPVGLAAGFDKDAHLVDLLPDVGFGFEEIGSVTGKRCEGNPKPRLWRLPKSQGLLVYYGLKNEGCVAISQRLKNNLARIPIGISIAKTNSHETVSEEAGIADYANAFRAFANTGAYLTINISCPNAYGGEPFTHPSRLTRLLDALDNIQTSRPVFLKMPADLDDSSALALLEIASHHRVHGMIFSNLTKRYDHPSIHPDERTNLVVGGVSGKPVMHEALRLLSLAHNSYGSRFVYIGCGGIFSAEDAYQYILHGASLVQLITGMIFEGPQLIGEINRDLVRLLQRDGFSSITEAVGSKAFTTVYPSSAIL
jgi:dihydroorotate dehydrogenase subfamily 2